MDVWCLLDELGDVRLLKIDAEGSEFPILLTATRLRQIELIALSDAGFRVDVRPVTGEARNGLFTAVRR